jgi:hypothetical protein
MAFDDMRTFLQHLQDNDQLGEIEESPKSQRFPVKSEQIAAKLADALR